MRFLRPIFVFAFISVQFLSLQGQSSFQVAFYNVENLFDTISDPNKLDTEFIPGTKTDWNSVRYWKKQQDLASVFDSMEWPEIIGVSEIENATVLKDLCKTMEGKKYDYVHYDAPDLRGIDVGLLYQPKFMKILSSKNLYVALHEGDSLIPTRDILYVEGKIKSDGDTLHIFVNHWPSRRGGETESEKNRLAAAKVLKTFIEQLWITKPNANIIVIGDFNDEPSNNSIANELLMASHPANEINLFNLAYQDHSEGKGSYNFRGKWNMLDQIIVSKSLADNSGNWQVGSFEIFRREFMVYKGDKYGDAPNRTYGGPIYYGGISDHFPVRVRIGRRSN
jgi:predicted extracellular nuclease